MLFEEVPNFEYNLTFPIMSSKFYQDEDFASTGKNNNPVGTGKYKISSVQSDRIILKQNQNWWNLSNQELKLETITLILYSNMGEVYNAFKLGSIDILSTSSLNYEEYIGTIGYLKKEYNSRQYDYIAFNCESKLLSNIEIRQAISHAIDKNNIVASIYASKYSVADFIIDSASYIYPKDVGDIEYNKDLSTQILEENGWEYKKDSWQRKENYVTTRLKLDFVVNQNNAKRVEVAENIVAQLNEIGISVNLIKASDSQYQNYLINKNYDMILTGNVAGFSPNLKKYVGDNNLAKFDNEEANQITREIVNITKDEKLLAEKYKRLVQILKDEMPYLSLYHSNSTLIYSPNLKGNIEPSAYNIYENIEGWYREY